MQTKYGQYYVGRQPNVPASVIDEHNKCDVQIKNTNFVLDGNRPHPRMVKE